MIHILAFFCDRDGPSPQAQLCTAQTGVSTTYTSTPTHVCPVTLRLLTEVQGSQGGVTAAKRYSIMVMQHCLTPLVVRLQVCNLRWPSHMCVHTLTHTWPLSCEEAVVAHLIPLCNWSTIDYNHSCSFPTCTFMVHHCHFVCTFFSRSPGLSCCTRTVQRLT